MQNKKKLEFPIPLKDLTPSMLRYLEQLEKLKQESTDLMREIADLTTQNCKYEAKLRYLTKVLKPKLNVEELLDRGAAEIEEIEAELLNDIMKVKSWKYQ